MNFTEGQIACEMANGFMNDFDETNEDIRSIYKTLAEKFGDQFYTNIQMEGHNWKWVRKDKILTHTKLSIWNEGEPNNLKTENCAQVQKDLDGKSYGLNNIDCSTKSNIICIKNNQ